MARSWAYPLFGVLGVCVIGLTQFGSGVSSSLPSVDRSSVAPRPVEKTVSKQTATRVNVGADPVGGGALSAPAEARPLPQPVAVSLSNRGVRRDEQGSISTTPAQWAHLRAVADQALKTSRHPQAKVDYGVEVHTLSVKALLDGGGPLPQLIEPTGQWHFLVRDQQRQVLGLQQIKQRVEDSFDEEHIVSAGLKHRALAGSMDQLIASAPSGYTQLRWVYVADVDLHFLEMHHSKDGGALYAFLPTLPVPAWWVQLTQQQGMWLQEEMFRALLRTTITSVRQG